MTSAKDRRITELEAMLASVEALSAYEMKPLPKETPRKGVRLVGCPVVQISDLHIDEIIHADEVNGINEYNPAIAWDRFCHLVDGITWLTNMHHSSYDFPYGILWLGGDGFSGHIHPELVETTAQAPLESAFALSEMYDYLLRRVLKETPVAHWVVVTSHGNHGRMTIDKRIATAAQHNLEYFLYLFLRDRWKEEERLSFHVSKAMVKYVRLWGYTLRFTHGDAINYGGGIGGITIPVNKAISQWDTVVKADITHIGHFHQQMNLPHLACNGSLIGYSPYSMHIKARLEKPRQNFYVLDSKEGMCLSTPIWVTK